MTDDTKAAREPGWYWVRPLGSDEWEIAQWHRWRGSIPETSGASWWRAIGTPLLDGDCAEIDERRITRAEPVAGDALAEAAERSQPGGVTITEAQRAEIAAAWEHLDRLIDGYASAKAALHAALMLPGIVPILGGRDD